jgi:hypothetical protein
MSEKQRQSDGKALPLLKTQRETIAAWLLEDNNITAWFLEDNNKGGQR